MDPQDRLVVVAYQDENAAQMVRERLNVLKAEDLITLDVAALVGKDQRGEVNVQQLQGHHGLRLLSRREKGSAEILDQITQEAAQLLQPGEAALCLLVQSVIPEKVVPELSKYGGRVIKTSLPSDREQLLKEAFAEQLTSEQISAELNR